jgi:Cation transport ATPase
VYSGFINVGNPVRVKALRGAGESRFQRVVRLALEALEEKGSVEYTIERFLWLWLPLVILSFIIAYIVLGPLRAPSILLVSCPSAFIITSAVNTAYSIASLARSGVVVRGSRPLERLHRVDTIVVDKTGTITYGSLRVSSISPPTGHSVEEFKTIVATVASASLHPVSRALSKLTDSRLEIESVVEHQGLGVEALVGGRRVLLGGPGLVKGLDVVSGCSEDEITVWILVDGSPGYVCLEEAVREDVVRALREAGDFRIIASGDSEPRVRRVAVKLGVREYYAGMKPEDKLKLVSMLKERGARVAFIGDGVNDIAALARADVGLAVGSIDVVANVGDIVLGENPGRLAEVLREARRHGRALTLSLTIIALIKLIALAGGLTGAIPLYMVALLGDDGATLAGITAVIAYRAIRT